MKRILQLILLFLPTLAFGQKFILMDTLDTYPMEITVKVKQEIYRVFRVDFTGDKVADFIVQAKMGDGHKFNEYWFNSNFELCILSASYPGSYDFIGLINLDSDPELELYSATGYEDGIDYALYDLNLNTRKKELLFYFNPVIIENDHDYWGYPWDTDGILTRADDGVTTIYFSIDHEIERDGAITNPEIQNVLPVIFLTGHSTQQRI
jgi:hypothetical protein